MALDGTYVGLQATVATWMHRTDLTAVIPDFVVMAESRIARDLRVLSQISPATLTVTAGNRLVAVPSGWLQFDNLSLMTNPVANLSLVSLDQMDTQFPDGIGPEAPRVYAMSGTNIVLAPTPDIGYTLTASYFSRFPALATAGGNWLLTNFPNVYLFAVLAEACAYAQDDERAPLWNKRYNEEVEQVQFVDDRGAQSGSMLRVRIL